MKLQHRILITFIAVAGVSVFVAQRLSALSAVEPSWAYAAAALVAAVGGVLTLQWLSQYANTVRACLRDEGDAMPMPGTESLIGSVTEWRDKTVLHLQQERQQWHDASDLVVRLTPVNGRGNLNPDAAPGTQLRSHLAQMASSARTEIQRILDLTDEIARRTRDTKTEADQQQTAVENTAAAIESMSVSIDSVSQTAEAATTSGTQALQSARAAQGVVHSLIAGMDNIRLHVGAAEKKLLALGERSQEIGSIVETISAISDRTDLLALNASIESVRAGENGRGFALVATEVRKLAEQTAGAAREVTALIDSMQTETQESIATMVEERAQVDQEVRRVTEAGEALESIGQSLAVSAQCVTEISTNANSQLEGAHTIVQGMQMMTNSSDGIRTHADEVRQQTMALAAAAQDLDESIAPLYGCTQPRAAVGNGESGTGEDQKSGKALLRDLAMEVMQ